MKKFVPVIALFLAFQSCNQPATAVKTNAPADDHRPKYVLTVYQDKFDQAASRFKPANITDTLRAANDTVAYLTALKQFYNQKITERKNGNYGQPKSFLLTDANGLDLKVKLTDRLTGGLKDQVENTPEVKTMIEEYKKDSL